ncbi:MAG: DNA internalization-related competence protein ComEC/Rec2 [Steroidobacter sp.]
MGRIGFAFLLGVCCIHSLSVLPAAVWALALAVSTGATACSRMTLPCAFLVGIAWAWSAAAVRIAGELPIALEGQDAEVRGYIASLPDIVHTDAQFVLDVVEAPAGIPERIRLAWYEAPATPHPGELWQFTVRLKRRNGFANPGGFDYEGHLFRDGIGATGYVRNESGSQRLSAAGHRYLTTRVRAWIAQRLAETLDGHRMLGVVQGLAVGDTRAMTAEQWRVFAATGTTHLMAISGLHISMVAALAAWAGGSIVRWRGAQARRWNALHGQVFAGAFAAIAYSTLAGLSVPTQRTLIMLCIYFAARWLRRELSVGHALGLALIGVLLVDPFAPLAVGAWLSFGAVAMILIALSGRLTRDGAIANFARVQVALTIGLTPFLLGAFGGLSLISPVANAIAVPLFTLVIVPTVLLGTLLAALSSAAGALILSLPAALLNLSWPALEWLAQQPFAFWYFAQPAPLVFIALAMGAALLVLPGVWPIRTVGALLCLPLLMNGAATPAPGDFDLTVLDVGQGLAAVVRTRSHVLVYDAGPAFQSGRDTGELVVLPYLRHGGVRRVDMLMISHGDLDHQGGVKSLISSLTIDATLRGPSVGALGGAICVRGQHWVWDDVEFEVLHPTDSGDARENDSSCVLRVRGPGGSALLTGDIEADAEATLAQSALTPVDVVIAPHHGSRTSSTPEFVAALRPAFAVFSAGYRNRWGFPKQDVVARWNSVGARSFDSAHSGAVEMNFVRGRPVQVREYRKTHARYWRR